MRFLVFTCCLVLSLTLQANESLEEVKESGPIGGVVSIKDQKEKTQKLKGILFIFVRKTGETKTPPLAVKQYQDPTFPLKFSINKSDKMIPRTKFVAPFWLKAKFLSNEGKKSFFTEVSPENGIAAGKKDLKIVLK